MIMCCLMIWLFGVFLLLLCEDVFVFGLLDGYYLVLENDLQFQVVIQEYEVGR